MPNDDSNNIDAIKLEDIFRNSISLTFDRRKCWVVVEGIAYRITKEQAEKLIK